MRITQSDNQEEKTEKFSNIEEIRENDRQYQESLKNQLQMMLLEKKKEI